MTLKMKHTFYPGTKALSGQVNENFSDCVDAINANSKDITDVREETEQTKKFVHGALKDEFVDLIKSNKTRFTVNAGAIDENGNANLLSAAGNILTATAPFVFTDVKGVTTVVDDDLTIDALFQNGTKYVAIRDNELEFTGEVFAQKTQPTPTNTGLEAKIPQMTSNTAPYGTVTTTGTWHTSRVPYKAIGRIKSNSMDNMAISTSNENSITYTFQSILPEGNYTVSLGTAPYVSAGTTGAYYRREIKITYSDNTVETVLSNKQAQVGANAVVETLRADFTAVKSIKSITFDGSTTHSVSGNNGGLIASIELFRKTGTTVVADQLWLKTLEPLEVFKFDGIEWTKYDGVPLGKVTCSTGAITAVETLPYNQNGYNINTQITGALTRTWISGEYAPVVNTPTIVNHDLNLANPLNAIGTTFLKKVAGADEAGYTIGDFAIEFYNASTYRPSQSYITKNTIQANTAASMLVVNKTTGAGTAISTANLSNWRYVFKINY